MDKHFLSGGKEFVFDLQSGPEMDVILQSAVFHDLFHGFPSELRFAGGFQGKRGIGACCDVRVGGGERFKETGKIFFLPLHKNTVNPSGILQDGKFFVGKIRNGFMDERHCLWIGVGKIRGKVDKPDFFQLQTSPEGFRNIFSQIAFDEGKRLCKISGPAKTQNIFRERG